MRLPRDLSGTQLATSLELHVAFEPDEGGWVCATIEELPGVITCAPTLEEARELIRGALAEWLSALTSEERVAVGEGGNRGGGDDEGQEAKGLGLAVERAAHGRGVVSDQGAG